MALALSMGLHLCVLTLPYDAPMQRLRETPAQALEIILVNARRPTKQAEPNPQAQALAQATWMGGGDAERGRARSNRPQSESRSTPTEAIQTMADQLKRLEQQQQAMLSQIKRQATMASPAQQRVLAEIERRIQEENTRPRKRFLGPSTQETVYAEYYDQLRRKIEAQGTRHFPTHLGQRLYGALTLILTVDTSGRMVSSELVQSSGKPELDRRARAIASSAAPFGEFQPDMKNQADQLAWVVRFTFSADAGLQTQWFEPAKGVR
ncbi:MAG: TonB family protein [Alphaproteobacteria bacterium]|nr:TonB family protein [Alphaproteobacteria bacterium]